MKPTRLQLPKTFDLPSGQKLTFDHAHPEDIIELKAWKRFSKKANTPAQRQAVKMALGAMDAWGEAIEDGSAAESLSQVLDHLRENPHADVSLFFCARADPFEQGHVVGIFLLRRTWCHSIWADYIAIHPLVARNPTSGFRGVGTIAFLAICLIARHLNIKRILGEATAFSHEFYQLILKRRVTDIAIIPKRKYEELLRGIEQAPAEDEKGLK